MEQMSLVSFVAALLAVHAAFTTDASEDTANSFADVLILPPHRSPRMRMRQLLPPPKHL